MTLAADAKRTGLHVRPAHCFAGIDEEGKRRVVFGQMNNEKNKKILYVIYIAAVLILAVFPFAGMSVAATDETTENKELAEFPNLKEEGKWNVDYLSDLGGYFEEHLLSVRNWWRLMPCCGARYWGRPLLIRSWWERTAGCITVGR